MGTMKAFIFLCLVAAAMAEADPQYFYGGAHSYSPYTAYSAGLHYNSPYVYSGVHSYSPYSGLYNHYGKREAEAEPKAEAEADPALIYSSPFAYSGAHSYSPYTTYSAGHHYGGLYNGVYNTPYVHGPRLRQARGRGRPPVRLHRRRLPLHHWPCPLQQLCLQRSLQPLHHPLRPLLRQARGRG